MNNTAKLTKAEWLAVFNPEAERLGGFSWTRWYIPEFFPNTKALLKEQNAYIHLDMPQSLKCIRCTARISVGDIVVLSPNEKGGESTTVLISNFRDPCDCDL